MDQLGIRVYTEYLFSLRPHMLHLICAWPNTSNSSVKGCVQTVVKGSDGGVAFIQGAELRLQCIVHGLW